MEFFPSNAVGYFVSYYDYYQPEAYLPKTDTFIEKDASINDEIDKLRHAATRALFERRDVIIIASVSCIYGLGSPEAYHGMLLFIETGMQMERPILCPTISTHRNTLSTRLLSLSLRIRTVFNLSLPTFLSRLYIYQCKRLNSIQISMPVSTMRVGLLCARSGGRPQLPKA